MKKSKHIIRSTVKIVSKIVYYIIRAAFAFIGFYIAGAYLSMTTSGTIRQIKLYGLKDGIAYAAESLITLAILVICAVVSYSVLYYAAKIIKKLIKSISA